jgi:hypothetical protein
VQAVELARGEAEGHALAQEDQPAQLGALAELAALGFGLVRRTQEQVMQVERSAAAFDDCPAIGLLDSPVLEQVQVFLVDAFPQRRPQRVPFLAVARGDRIDDARHGANLLIQNFVLTKVGIWFALRLRRYVAGHG